MEYTYTVILYHHREKIIAIKQIIVNQPLFEKMELTIGDNNEVAIRVIIERIHHLVLTGETLLCCGVLKRLDGENDGEYAIFPFSWFNIALVKQATGWLIKPSTGFDAFITSTRHVISEEALRERLEAEE